ncbi:QLQ domain-containing protein [Trichonephila clavipes]|nr:QLQ domain-containing protein [Trichonephila clavipes]
MWTFWTMLHTQLYGNISGKAHFLFQQDNCSLHTLRLAQTWFDDMGVQKLELSSQSPDLSHIEQLWDELERRLRSQPNQPSSLQELTSAVMDAWKAIPMVNYQNCQVIYSQFGLAIHQNDHQARRRFVEWAKNEIAVVPDFHRRILFSDEAHFWLNGYVNKQNCRIWSEANPQVYVETPLHPEKLTVWCALWAGGILLQKR